MRLEWERMWRRVWLYAGPLADLEQVGDYFTFEIGPESVLVVRTAPDQVAAMYNVCQHRGRRLRPEGGGFANSFKCPYHLWRYDLDGRLISAPDGACDFPQGDPGACGVRIPQVRCEVWEGLVFVNFDDAAPPLSEYLTSAVMEHLERYRWASEFRINLDWTVEWPCNWKVGVDSFNEIYHLQGIHPELMDMSDDTPAGCPIDFYGRHSRILYRVGVPGPRWDDAMAQGRGYRDSNQLTAGVRMMLKAYGLEARPEWDGHVKELRPTLIKAARGARKSRASTSAGWSTISYSMTFTTSCFPTSRSTSVLIISGSSAIGRIRATRNKCCGISSNSCGCVPARRAAAGPPISITCWVTGTKPTILISHWRRTRPRPASYSGGCVRAVSRVCTSRIRSAASAISIRCSTITWLPLKDLFQKRPPGRADRCVPAD